MMRSVSMKTKMATLVSGLFLLILASGAFMLEKFFEKDIKKTIGDQQYELVSKIAADVENQMREAQVILINVSKLLPTDDIENYPAMQKHMEKLLESRFFLKTYFDNGIILYSRTGKAIAEVPYSGERYGKDFSTRDYFQYTLKVKAPFISKPIKSVKAPYDPVVIFSVPVFNKRNEIVGVLGGSVSLLKDATFGGIAKIRVGKTGYMFLYNTDRTVIVHPDKTRILTEDRRRGMDPVFDAAIDSHFEGSKETISPRGVRGITSLKRFQTTDWILGAHYPIKDAYASIYRERWYLAGYTALGISLCVLIILIVMRRNLSPLSELAAQAGKIGKAKGPLKFVTVDAGGEIGGLASSFNAMLERLADRERSLTETMDELADREARISSIVNTTVEGIITINEDQRIESFNPAAEKIFGYGAVEVIGHDVDILMPEPDRLQHAEHFRRYIARDTSKISGIAREVTARRKDGTTFPIELSISEANLGHGRLFTGVLRDITERKKAEDELRILYNAVEQSSAVVVITDLEGNIEYVNPKFVEVTGYERSEIFGKTPRVLKSGEMSQAVYHELWETITSGSQWQGIFHDRKKSGDLYWAAASISPIMDSTGRIIRFVGIQEDITAVKTFEEELRSAKEAAETANQAKSDFLAGVSHEIRTPMNAIIGAAELLLESPLDDEQRRYVTTLRNAGANLLNIINDILDISKIEAGRLELELAPFDLADLLDGICDIMSIRVREKGIALDCDMAPDVPRSVIGDAGRLRQVLLNLVGNAVKFTETGGIRIGVTMSARESDRGTFQFSVTDTGIGIPEEKRAHIFRKFTQADSSITRRYGGTGLGLAISRRLVKLMDSDIGVTSTVGSGSTFVFTASLGIETRDEAIAKIVAGGTQEREVPAAGPRPLNVLLVDDSQDNRLIVEAFLKKMPFHIETAEDGKRAVDMFKGSSFDIVLMDIQMPVMDGYEATRQIRQWERATGQKPAPILALTAYALEEEIRKSHDAGCSGHLSKPITKSVLIDAIMAHTGGTATGKSRE